VRFLGAVRREAVGEPGDIEADTEDGHGGARGEVGLRDFGGVEAGRIFEVGEEGLADFG
jgi:hypothetical protein